MLKFNWFFSAVNSFTVVQGRVVWFQDQLFPGSGDRVVLQADRVPSFVVPFCQSSSTADGNRTVS